MDMYLKGSKVGAMKFVNKGGEADIFDIGNGLALKVFKPPDHPDFAMWPREKVAAKNRIAEHQKKLPAFPKNLPSRVVVPIDLATDRFAGGKIVGYAMRFLAGAEKLLRYGEPDFRKKISGELVVKIFKDLRRTVEQIHRANVVIGDFKDLNVLVENAEAYIIDSDSFQFGPFLTKGFTENFVDPLLCDSKKSPLELIRPHNAFSDWYAFTMLLIQTLLAVHPYGGVYKPKQACKRITHQARPLHRVTIFHPEVFYTKHAVSYEVLPDDLLHYFHLVFEKDRREVFPEKLLDLRWAKCPVCGIEHARGVCPNCKTAQPAAIKQKTVVRGKIVATSVFKTRGMILFTAMQNGKLLWLFHENGKFFRENRQAINNGEVNPLMRFRIQGERTLIGLKNTLVVFAPQKKPETLTIDAVGNMAVFDANEETYFFSQSGALFRVGDWGQEFLGDVLLGRTHFWTGEDFGLGWYDTEKVRTVFLFDAMRPRLNDRVVISFPLGEIIDSTAIFSKDKTWFFVASAERGSIVHHVWVIRKDGTVEAEEEAVRGDGSWLSNTRGKCVINGSVLAATDDGIKKVEPIGGRIFETKTFPDYVDFVDSSVRLFPANDGLYVIGEKEIKLLKIT